MRDILWLITSLMGVLGLMFLLFFGLRMLNRRISTTGGRLRVLDRASLGRDSMMLVVSVCGKLMLIGVSAQRVEKLADLDLTEQEYIDAAFSDDNRGVMPFSDILSSFMLKKKGNKEGEKDNEDDEIS